MRLRVNGIDHPIAKSADAGSGIATPSAQFVGPSVA
jgi:hypothetical protein